MQLQRVLECLLQIGRTEAFSAIPQTPDLRPNMAAVQLSFSLRTSSNAKTVHLLGSWDNYNGQLPLSTDSSSKKGSWKGTFRFQGTTLQQGQRYWYYVRNP